MNSDFCNGLTLKWLSVHYAPYDFPQKYKAYVEEVDDTKKKKPPQ